MSNIPNIPNQKDYKDLTPFDLVLIQKFPFIEEDFDAINLYGILNKIKDYLNNVIANEQIVTENQENLNNSFTELHNYVEDYFTNIDVQEEINNKLDDLVSDGTLTLLIGNYVNPIISNQNSRINEIDTKISSIKSGAPIPVSNINQMTDTNKTYLLTTNGYWYFYNENTSEWQQGGIYQATDVNDNSINHLKFNTQLKNQLYVDNDISIEITTDKYVGSNGSILTQNGYFYSTPVPMEKDDTIVFYGKGYLTNVAMISTCNSRGGNITPQIISSSSDAQIYSFTAQEDCYVIISGFYSFYVSSSYLYKYKKIASSKAIEPLNNMYNFFDESDIVIKSTDEYEYSDNSYIRYDTGNAMQLNNVKATSYIDLPYPDCKLKLSSSKIIQSSDPDFRGLAFYDENKNYISGYQYQSNTKYFYVDIPNNAKYIRFTITGGMYTDFTLQYISLNEILKKFMIKETNINPLEKLIYDGGFMNIFNKINCIGDSLTIGTFESIDENNVTHYNVIQEYSYPAQLQRILGLSNSQVKVYAKGGECASNSQQSITDGHSWNNDFNDMFSDVNKADCYIIALGTNDIGYYNEFTGTVMTDVDINNYNNNAKNSVGGYATIIQRIKELQPKAKIFCVGIPNTRNSSSSITTANQKINAICDLFSNVYFLDMQKYGVQQNDVTSYKSIYYMGGHRSTQGYYRSAIEISSYIDYVIRTNPNEFKEVCFIGTDLSY